MTDEDILNRLQEIGCPYGIDDPRSRVWLDGYSAASEHELKKLREELAQ